MHADGSRAKQFETFHCNKYLNGPVAKEEGLRETQRGCGTHTHSQTHTLLLPESAISVRQNDNTEKCSKVSTTWQREGKGAVVVRGGEGGNPAATRGQGCSAVWRGPRGACDMPANQQQAEIPKKPEGVALFGLTKVLCPCRFLYPLIVSIFVIYNSAALRRDCVHSKVCLTKVGSDRLSYS